VEVPGLKQRDPFLVVVYLLFLGAAAEESPEPGHWRASSQAGFHAVSSLPDFPPKIDAARGTRKSAITAAPLPPPSLPGPAPRSPHGPTTPAPSAPRPATPAGRTAPPPAPPPPTRCPRPPPPTPPLAGSPPPAAARARPPAGSHRAPRRVLPAQRRPPPPRSPAPARPLPWPVRRPRPPPARTPAPPSHPTAPPAATRTLAHRPPDPRPRCRLPSLRLRPGGGTRTEGPPLPSGLVEARRNGRPAPADRPSPRAPGTAPGSSHSPAHLPARAAPRSARPAARARAPARSADTSGGRSTRCTRTLPGPDDRVAAVPATRPPDGAAPSTPCP